MVNFYTGLFWMIFHKDCIPKFIIKLCVYIIYLFCLYVCIWLFSYVCWEIIAVVEQEQRLRMRELAAAAYAEGVAYGKEAALTALGATKTPLQVLSTDQDQVEYFTVPSPTGPVQVKNSKTTNLNFWSFLC